MSYIRDEVLSLSKNEVVAVVALLCATISLGLLGNGSQFDILPFDLGYIGLPLLVGSTMALMNTISSQAQN